MGLDSTNLLCSSDRFDYGDRFWDIKSRDRFTCQCGSEKCKHSAEAIALEQSRLARLDPHPELLPELSSTAPRQPLRSDHSCCPTPGPGHQLRSYFTACPQPTPGELLRLLSPLPLHTFTASSQPGPGGPDSPCLPELVCAWEGDFRASPPISPPTPFPTLN